MGGGGGALSSRQLWTVRNSLSLLQSFLGAPFPRKHLQVSVTCSLPPREQETPLHPMPPPAMSPPHAPPLPKSELPGRDSFYDLRLLGEFDGSWEQRQQLFFQPGVLEAGGLTVALCQLGPTIFSLPFSLLNHVVSVAGRFLPVV